MRRFVSAPPCLKWSLCTFIDCCIVWQCVGSVLHVVCCSVLQCIAMCCCVLLCFAMCCGNNLFGTNLLVSFLLSKNTTYFHVCSNTSFETNHWRSVVCSYQCPAWLKISSFRKRKKLIYGHGARFFTWSACHNGWISHSSTCVAVCGSLLQCVAVCCSVLKCGAVCCSGLPWVEGKCIIIKFDQEAEGLCHDA